MKRIYSSLIAVSTLAGCVAQEPSDEATSSTEQFQKCPEWGCGENSPVAGPYRIRELNFRDPAADNGNHVHLQAFQKVINGTVQTFQVDVLKDQVRALIPGTTTVALEHAALVGGWFLLSSDAYDGYPAGWVRIKILSVDNQAFWQPPSTAYVETYELAYNGIDTPPSEYVSLCSRPLAGTGIRNMAKDPAEDRTWKNRYNSIIFSGDRYSETYTVSAGARALSWMNIACAGSVTAKLHLNRHTTASQVQGYAVNTLAQRQTMLKMYAGDFCGNGEAYTVKGTPIHWENKNGLNSGPGNDTAFESMWNENGAMCMEKHRLASSPVTAEKEMEEEVRVRCAMQKCSTFADYTNFNLYGNYIKTLSPQ